MKWCKPDYKRSGLNVISSISGHLGFPLPYASYPELDALLNDKQYRNIVLVLLDGMSMEIMRTHLKEDAFLRRYADMTLTTVYPSTTPNATSCLETGCSPREHGWLGWTLYFKQLEKPVDIFINRSNGEPAADYHVANRFIPREMIFSKISAAGQAKANCISRFTDDIKVDTLEEALDTAVRLAKDEERRYLYVYWSEPDHSMHTLGYDHPDITERLLDLNAKMEKLAADLPKDSLLLVTADHGMINARHLYLEDHPDVEAMLVHPPTIEARAAAFHVKPECLSAFPGAFRNAFGENFLLMDRETFIRDYLGDGPVRPQVYDFVGDYMALATDLDSICHRHEDFKLTGMHGGLTEQEMLVPLIVFGK